MVRTVRTCAVEIKMGRSVKQMDREKVIKGIEYCLTIDSPCGDCPYYSHEDIQELDCERNLRHDALALLKEQGEQIKNRDESLEKAREEIEWLRGMLKEQEAVEARKKNDGIPQPWTSWWYVCGDCGQEIEYHDRFCRWCGRSVKW